MGILGGIINFTAEALTGNKITSEFLTEISVDRSEEIFEKLIQKWDEIFQKKELVEKFELSKASETLPDYFDLGTQNLEMCKSASGSFSFFGTFDKYKWDQQFYISYKPSKEKELIFSYSNFSQNDNEYKCHLRFIEAALYLKYISGTSVLETEKILTSDASWLNDLQNNNLEKFCNIDGKSVFYNHFKEFFIPIINFKNAEKIERERLEKEKERLEFEAREAKRREEEKLLLKRKELEQQKKMEAQEKENKRVANLLSDLDSF
ncbi:MAG: hypothetical protein SOT46_07730 [Treponema sp.]|nr:hypothetical protein [Treponema sp.]